MATDINASERASTRFAAEVALARREVDRNGADCRSWIVATGLPGSARPVAQPERHGANFTGGLDHLSEAEAALAKVAADHHDARLVRQEMAPPAEYLVERMSDAGFGEPAHVRASDVLARLRATAGGRPVSHLIESTSNA